MDPTTLHSFAERQHHVVTREQLLALGLKTDAIAHRIAKGILHPVGRGVYAVGRRDLSPLGRWMAAVLRCGPGAVLSHESAAALWKIRRGEPATIEISVPAHVVRRRAGIVVHRRLPDVMRHETTTAHRIPVTTPLLVLVDLAPRLTRDALEAAINEADKRGLIDPERLRQDLERLAGHPGAGVLRTTLDRRTFTMTDSKLERLFLPIARRAGLPRPVTQCWVNGARVDFFFRELGLVIETDGLRYHRTPAAQANDRVRDQKHSAAGLASLRFTRAQVRFEPDYVCEILVAVARNLRR